jgi:peroxiredoxin
MGSKNKMKKIIINNLYILMAIISFIVLGIILIEKPNSKMKFLNKNPYRSIDLERITLPSFKIDGDFENDGLCSDDLNAKLNILIFFTFEDCSFCLFEAEFWSLTAKMFADDVKIFGIVNEKNDEYISSFIKEYDILFPIIIDVNDILKNNILSLRNISDKGIITPFKIFITNQHIFHIEGPSKELERQENFPERVQRLLEKIIDK